MTGVPTIDALQAEGPTRVFAHPIMQLAADVQEERRLGTVEVVGDHGTWMGNWPLPGRDELVRMHDGRPFGAGMSPLRFGRDDDNQAYLAQKAGRKEINWNRLGPIQKEAFSEALQKQWKLWLDNQAVEVLSPKDTLRVETRLKQAGESERILQMRTVLTDKNDGLRTHTMNLPLEASARLIVPGFKDGALLEGKLRTDAPTGTRNAQMLLCLHAGSNPNWFFCSADVRAAFLKGKPYVGRELYVRLPDGTKGPAIRGADKTCIAKVLKGVFGLADAPREWYLRLAECLAEHGWVASSVDAAFWSRRDSAGNLSGLIVGHVDDLLCTGNEEAHQSILAIGDTLGFGRIEYDDFVWCGKRMRRAADKFIRLSMKHYHENLSVVNLPQDRRRDVDSPLSEWELRQFRAVMGSLQWLVAQVRWDLGFRVSSLAGEVGRATVGSILRANAVIVEAKIHSDFELVFPPMDLERGGIMVVTDAALGNVDSKGTHVGPADSKVHSQASYFIAFCDPQMLDGNERFFAPLDARSHRLPRVTRSSFGAETMGLEEGVDAGQLIRAMVAELRGQIVLGRCVLPAVDKVPCTCVVDAKDAHDKVISDTASWGSAKSLAFTIAWLKQQFRRANISLRWTATENMFVDAGTKEMDNTHFRRILTGGAWSISYHPDYVKAKHSSRKLCADVTGVSVLPGTVVPESATLQWLEKARSQTGWHNYDGSVYQVARMAKSHRTPEPRFSSAKFPLRSSYVRVAFEGKEPWRKIEDRVNFLELPNQHASLSFVAPVLVSLVEKP